MSGHLQDLNAEGVRELLQYLREGDKAEIQIATPGSEAGAPVLVLPVGKQIHDLKPLMDKYRLRPERREGTAHMETVESFTVHVKRFKDDNSALFATRKGPAITAVLDYHMKGGEGLPRFGKHRSAYCFPLSDEWTAWSARSGSNGTAMNQSQFAAFLEDRIGDVLPPPTESGADMSDSQMIGLGNLLGGTFAGPTRLIELSRGLAVRQNETVRNAVILQTGESSISFTATHTDENGVALKVPSLFLIAIPVFRNGPLYKMAVRLRYRVDKTNIIWFYELYRADKVFDHAFSEACSSVATATSLPLFYGSPE